MFLPLLLPYSFRTFTVITGTARYRSKYGKYGTVPYLFRNPGSSPHVNPLVVHGRGWNLLFVRLLLSTGAGTCRGSRADSSQALEDISNTSSQNVDGSAYSPVFGVDGHAKRYRLFHVVQFRPDGHERIAQFVE